MGTQSTRRVAWVCLALAMALAVVLPVHAMASGYSVYSVSKAVPNPVVPHSTWMTGEMCFYPDRVDVTLNGLPYLSMNAPVQKLIDAEGGLYVVFGEADDYGRYGFQFDSVTVEQDGQTVFSESFDTVDPEVWQYTGTDPYALSGKPVYDRSYATMTASDGVVSVRPNPYRGGAWLYTADRVVTELPAKVTFRVNYPGYSYRQPWLGLPAQPVLDSAGRSAQGWTGPMAVFVPGTTSHAFMDKLVQLNLPDFYPVSAAGPDRTVAPNMPATFDGSLSSDVEGPLTSYTWHFGDGATGNGISADHAYADPGTYEVKLVVVDSRGQSSIDTATVTVESPNNAPQITVDKPELTVSEGGIAHGRGLAADADGDALTVTADTGAIVLAPDGTWSWFMLAEDGPAETTVTVTATDTKGAFATETFRVVTRNEPASLTSLSVEASATYVSDVVKAAVSFRDPGLNDTHVAIWTWGDGTTSLGVVDEVGGAGVATGSHAYSVAGVFPVSVEIMDNDGASRVLAGGPVTVTPGYVSKAMTGGGWLKVDAPNSKARRSSRLAFGFNAKEIDGVLRGNVLFQLPGRRFKAGALSSLKVVDKSAWLSGSGQLDGVSGYSFILAVTDGSPDKVRVKIWATTSGEVVFDTTPGAADSAMPSVRLTRGAIHVRAD